MFSLSTFSLMAMTLLPKVYAHGHLKMVTIDGQGYVGPVPGTPMVGGSAIRMVSDVGPVTDDSSPDLNCGLGAATQEAALSGVAKAGSTVSTFWVNGDDGNWVHNVGPIMTYLADCKGDCSKADSMNAEWMKIDQAGLADGSASTWVMANTFDKGLPYNFTLPEQLPTGNYLMRHEIIALHNAQAPNGAEHYTACMNLKVTGGSQSVQSLPTTNAVKFPGGYNPQDPGLLINVYNPGFKYTFPGPPLAFAASSTNGTSSAGSGSDAGSSADSGSSSSSSSAVSSSSTMYASATASAAAPGATNDGSDDGSDCDDDSGDDDSDSGSGSTSGSGSGSSGSGSGAAPVAVVTEYVTITVHKAQPTATSTVTATSTIVANKRTIPTGQVHEPRRRSRIMRALVSE